MEIYATQLIGVSLKAIDGKIGTVKDIYFDDQSWEVRYLVVDTGNWLLKKSVLIAPCAFGNITDSPIELLPVNLTIDQIKESPDIDSDMPVSRQQEQSLFNHYSWPNYGRLGIVAKDNEPIGEFAENSNYDPHLRSFRHISKYEVYNSLGLIGATKDLMVNMENGKISLLLLDDVLTTDKERVVISTDKIDSVNWDTYRIDISLGQEELDSAPIINAKNFFSNEIHYPPLT